MSVAETSTAFAGSPPAGPLEARHLRSQNYRNAANTTRLTSTHWHIAWANGLGWGFDGMDGAILALVAPLLMKEFAIDLGTYRSGVQIALFVSIVGLYLWPWLADKFGRRNILALNIAVFSLAMPLVALSPGWGSFILIYSIVRFALNGEWAVGSMLVAETWPARLRGLVLSVDRCFALDEGDRQWIAKTEQPGWRQLFLPDLRRNTVMATLVASLALVSYSTVGMWMPLFLAQQHGWSTAEYGSFYIWWALFATTGFWAGGWMIDRLGRRVGFAVLLIEAAVFMTIWIFAHDKIGLWLLGMAWSWGFIGVWGPVTTYTAEMYPTRIRGVGNGFSWAVAFLIGAVLWPFVSVYLRETTGSFIAAFLLIPVILLGMAAIIWFYSPEHARKELDAISV